jgi:hypothetical protein
MPITQTISSIGTPPSISDPATFESRADNVLNNGLPTLVTQLNTFAGQANSLESNVNAKAVLLEYYQGALAADPILDTNGNALVAGDWYVNTVSGSVRVYSGSSWVQAVGAVAGVSSVNGQSGAVTGVVTESGTQALTNKTLGAGTSLGATLTGQDNLVTRIMLQDTGWDFHDSGTTNALNYVNGSVQRWAPNTGAQTLSITNWPPSGAMGELLIQGVNLGAATITWPTINWIKSDGTTTTTFSSNGVTLQTSGTDWVFLWTRDAGTTIFGKVVR